MSLLQTGSAIRAPAHDERGTWRSPARTESGVPLDETTRSALEAGFHHDFASVRVHVDDRAADAARGLHARAFTVGSDIHFARGAYEPATTTGRQLLAHELAHVVQQGGRRPAGIRPDVGGERAAHTAAHVVAGGGVAHVSARAATGPQLQDEDPAPVPLEGLKTVASQLQKNEKLKKEVIEPLTAAAGDEAKREWGSLSTPEKVGVVGFGVGTAGIAGGALLSDPKMRAKVPGLNIAAPLTLIPYTTLTHLTWTPPAATAGMPPIWQIKTGFDFGDLMKLFGDRKGWKGLGLTLDLEWSYDARSKSLSLAGGTGKLGILPGLSLTGGTYKDILPAKSLFPTDTGFVESRQSLPEMPKPPGTPDMRVMLQFDVIEFARSGIIPGLDRVFGYSPEKKK